MVYFLDTHTLLLWFSSPHILSKRAHAILANGNNVILISSVTTWEIAIKKSLGKLTVPDTIFSLIQHESFTELPITIEHTKALLKLPHHHTDPFDRLLAAQALVEKVPIISRDKILAKYKITVVIA